MSCIPLLAGPRFPKADANPRPRPPPRYLIYLLITWGINAWQMWVRIQAILALEGTFKTACNTVGAFMDLGNCDDFFSKIKRWTYEGGLQHG